MEKSANERQLIAIAIDGRLTSCASAIDSGGEINHRRGGGRRRRASGPTPVVIPVIIWAWFAMDTVPALLFTVYMIPVNLIDNVLRPLLMGRGLDTPIVVILIGLIGGTLSLGLTGLFLGPIVLAVIWELVVAWIRESESA